MKKTGKPVVTIYGNNNKVTFSENKSHLSYATVIKLLIAVAVLAVSLCCPELRADIVRWIISVALGS